MKAGRYYIGDLCYCMQPQWNEVCNMLFPDRSGNGIEGEFELKNGVKFASFSTVYGDGVYLDQKSNSYPVDSGSIGCILVDDIDDPNADLVCGRLIDFSEDFNVSSEEGFIYIGHVIINTNDIDDEDEGFE